VSSRETSVTTESFASVGKSFLAKSALSFNSLIAVGISTLERNCTVIADTLLNEFEVIVSIHFILLTCFSIFFVTRSSIISGLAQGMVVTTVPIPIWTSGLDSSGRAFSDINQAMIIIIISKIRNLVLSKKKLKKELSRLLSYSSFSRYFDLIW
jgi:hypothetical protein